MHGPEAAQEVMRRLQQRNEEVPVTLGIPNMHVLTDCIDIADLQAQPLAQTQSQAVEREVEHPVADHARDGEQAQGFRNRDEGVQTTIRK